MDSLRALHRTTICDLQCCQSPLEKKSRCPEQGWTLGATTWAIFAAWRELIYLVLEGDQ